MRESLTICIPTYNRRAELSVALESIKNIFGHSVSVVVSDNASTDGTSELCAMYKESAAFKELYYYRWDSNQGADRNYLKSVELSRTEYCMLMGSDDAVLPDTPAVLADVLLGKPDVAIFGRNMYSRDLTILVNAESFWRGYTQRRFSLAQDADYNEYFKTCRSLAAVFSYLSVIVFRKSIWIENAQVQNFIGTAYVHVAALLEGMRNMKPCILQIDARPIVKCRGGNDSFLSAGHYQRFLLDWNGYEKLADIYFPASRRILTQILAKVYRAKCMIVLRYDLERQSNTIAIRQVAERLRSSDWGRQALWWWRLSGFIPVSALKYIYLARKNILRRRTRVTI